MLSFCYHGNVIMFFDNGLRLVAFEVISKGVNNSSPISQRKMLEAIVKANAERIVEIEEVYKVKEILKKLLTKRGESGRIVKLSQITATERQKDHG